LSSEDELQAQGCQAADALEEKIKVFSGLRVLVVIIIIIIIREEEEE